MRECGVEGELLYLKSKAGFSLLFKVGPEEEGASLHLESELSVNMTMDGWMRGSLG